MSYVVRLEIFEGPLDLLLHLINRNEVQITDIPIALITSQYLETIDLMKSLNLDVAGEYLFMAAYLTHIKSQMLLPNDAVIDPEEIGPDPRRELVAHLLEYKRHREAAEMLNAGIMLGRDVFVREAPEEIDYGAIAEPINVSVGDLVDAFNHILARTSRRDLIEMVPEKLLVKDKINEILDLLKEKNFLAFDSLMETDSSRINMLIGFLAILELVKLQLIKLIQQKPFGPILLHMTDLPESLDGKGTFSPEL